MPIRVGINGFGRIGRGIMRAIQGRPDIEVVWINDLTSVDMLAALLARDSTHGPFPAPVLAEGQSLRIGTRSIGVSAIPSPKDIPWGEHGVDVVLECTGIFRSRDKAAGHLLAGAKRVVLSAPGKNVDATFVMGVNDHTFNPDKHIIVSNASCTTNCLAPVANTLHQLAQIKHGWMSTIHAYTMDQNLLDAPHRKGNLRRARAAATNVFPTETGAATAIGLVVPALNGKLDGRAIRVPIPAGSLVQLTAQVEQETDVQTLLDTYTKAASGALHGILAVSHDPLVSSDIVGDPHSAIIDAEHVGVLGGHLVDLVAWYDNETGFSHRMIDLSLLVGAAP